MKELFAGGVLKLVATWQKMLQTAEYNLIVIEEEQVPLAPGDALGDNRFLTATLIGMSILLLGTVLMIYRSKCKVCRVRIRQLGGNEKLQWNSWNLKRLKETVNEMEWQLAGEKKRTNFTVTAKKRYDAGCERIFCFDLYNMDKNGKINNRFRK